MTSPDEESSQQISPVVLFALVGGAAVTTIVVVLVLGLTVFGWFDDPATSSASRTPPPPALWEAPTTTQLAPAGPLPPFQAPAGGVDCVYTPTQGQASGSARPPSGGSVSTQPSEIDATIVTDLGPLGVTLDNKKAPCTVHSFVNLATQGYFDDSPCHRLTDAPNFALLQCGDPTGTGAGDPGYAFANEYPTDQYPKGDPALRQPVVYPRGTVAMANGGPNTNGSQFFLVFADTELPPTYTIFGTIDEAGLALLDQIGQAGVADGTQDGSPAQPVTVTRVSVG